MYGLINRYCGSSYYSQETVHRSYYAQQSYSSHYTTSCGFWGESRCDRYSTRYRSAILYYTGYMSQHQCSQYCCAGYEGTAPHSCQPVCGIPCENQGTCSAPNTCSCISQWTGSYCTTPICVPECANGGLCSSPGVCSCTSDWSGPRCNDPVCSPGCANGGTCTAPNNCSCTAQWTGSTCEVDVNECDDELDNCEQDCFNEAGTFSCGCLTGYLLDNDGFTCNNINECKMSTHNCSQLCTDNIGSFDCSCRTGYRLNGRTQCDDIDECLGNPCDHSCTNNAGSFECGCNEEYRLQEYTSCVDINECEEIKPCGHVCFNYPGAYNCSCRNGYELDEDGSKCNDVDECARGRNIHGCSQGCDNFIGGRYCFCDSGYLLSSDGVSCEVFQLTEALSTPALPQNAAFLKAIRNGLDMCTAGSVCNCIDALFTTLSKAGLTQDVVSTSSDSISVFFDREHNAESIIDLILAIFGADSSIALPVVANIKELGYNCSNQEFTAEIFQTGGDVEIFPDLVSLSRVSLRVSISSVWSSPQLESILLMGAFRFGTISLHTFVETNNPDVWTFGATLGNDTEVNVIELITSAIGVDIPSEPFGDLITVTDMSMTGLLDVAANYQLTIVFKGTVHISDWYEEDVCIIVFQTLKNAGRKNTPQFGFISGCMEASPILFSSLVNSITGINLSEVPFFGSFELPRLHIVYTTANFNINLKHLTELGIPDQEFGLDLPSTGFRFIFYFYLERIKDFKSWILHKVSGSFSFRPVSFDIGSFSLSDIVSLLSDTLSLPSVDLFDVILDGLVLRKMDFNLEDKRLVLSIKIPGKISLFIDSFSIGHLSISFDLSFEGSITFNSFAIAGVLRIGGTTFHVSIAYTSGTYDLIACAKNFNGGFGSIASALLSSLDSSIVVSSFSFDAIGLYDPCFELKFNVGQFPVYMCLTADLFRSDFANIALSACLTQQKKWVFGFEIRE